MSTDEPKAGDIVVDGIRLHYLDWGGSGAPIVLLHATGFLGRIYRPIAEALTSVGRVFSYDQRGHGDSGRPAGNDYDWQHSMDDLAGFITAMKLQGTRGFGHSAGATAIGSLASERPDLITRAVLAEPVVFETPNAPEASWQNPFYERTLKRRREFDTVESMFNNFDRKPPYHSWRKDMLRDYCEHGTFVNGQGRRELKCSPEVEALYYLSSRNFDGLGRIIKCPVPLLILFGERSDSLGVVLAEKIASQIRNGRVVKMSHVGHFLPMEQPGEVARLAAEFLREG